MDFKQLLYFVKVAELGSFTRASAVLNIAQPALSRQVRLLEVELRQTLLDRNGRGITLTEAGKVLLEHGRGVLHQVEHLREAVAWARGALVGRVAIGLPPTISKILTVPVTREFRRQLPDAILSISEGLSATTRDALLSGRLDVALLYNAQPTLDIELRPLLEEELVLVQRLEDAGPDPVVSLDQLARYPLIIPTRPNAIRAQVEAEFSNVGLQPTIGLEIDGVPSILDLVADGAGSAILSRNAVTTSGYPGRFAMRRLTPSGLKAKLFMATTSRRAQTPTQQATLQLLDQVAKRLLVGS